MSGNDPDDVFAKMAVCGVVALGLKGLAKAAKGETTHAVGLVVLACIAMAAMPYIITLIKIAPIGATLVKLAGGYFDRLQSFAAPKHMWHVGPRGGVYRHSAGGRRVYR